MRVRNCNILAGYSHAFRILCISLLAFDRDEKGKKNEVNREIQSNVEK
jgi:hypothetical protein